MNVKKNRAFYSLLVLFFIVIIASASWMMWGNGILHYLERYENTNFIDAGRAYNAMSIDNVNEYSRLSKQNLDILEYELNIEIFPDEKKINGIAIITGVKSKGESGIKLNFRDGFEIDSILIDQSKIQYSYKNDFISLSLPADIDTFEVLISYSGNPEAQGFGAFEFGEKGEQKVIYSINEPVFASTWYPCHDVPDDKALLTISITNDSSYTSASNGYLENIKVAGSKKTYTWKTKYPVSTYLISVNSAKYRNFTETYIGADTLLLDYYVLPETYEKALRDFAIHTKTLKCFEELFGEYPFYGEKYGVAEILWDAGAMEHQTITGMGSDLITGHGFYDDFFIHELAHHWWGDAVGPATWNDIWINEGFATYSEALYYEYYNGKKALASTMENIKGTFDDTALFPPDGFIFSDTFYDKGAWVLHMLRRNIGDESFFRLLKQIYADYRYKNISTIEFIDLAERISGKKLGGFFTQWLTGRKGIPYIDYIVKQTQNKDEYITEIELMQDNIENTTYTFPLDIRYTYYDDVTEDFTYQINNRIQRIVFRSKSKVKSVTLDPDTWLLADIREDSGAQVK